MERVAHILEQDPQPRLGVVLSACRGVTDALLNLVAAAERQEDVIAERLNEIYKRHETIATTLLSREDRGHYLETLTQDCRDIAGILQTVRLIRSGSQIVRDLIAGYGEIWSTRLFSAYLRHRGRRPGKVEWIDARDIVSVEWGPLGPAVRWEESHANTARLINSDSAATLIITGFTG
jgi:aspartokinase/homoserine dehydrogenase 1